MIPQKGTLTDAGDGDGDRGGNKSHPHHQTTQKTQKGIWKKTRKQTVVPIYFPLEVNFD